MNEIELRKKYELEVAQRYMLEVNKCVNEAMVRHYDKDCDSIYNRQIMEQYKNLVYQENGKIKVSKSGCASLFAGYFMSNFNNNGNLDPFKFILNLINVPNNIIIIHLNNKIHNEVYRIRQIYLDNPNSRYCIYNKIKEGLNELELQLQDEETLDMIEYLGVDEFYNMASEDMSGLTKLFDEFFEDIQPLKKLLDERYKKLNW